MNDRHIGAETGHSGEQIPGVWLPTTQITYTLQHAADLIDLSVATLRRLEKAGRLRFVKIGGRTLVSAHSLHSLGSGR